MPRQSPLTPKFIDELCKRILTTFYYKTAIESMGYSQEVFYKWRRRGEAEIARRDAIEAELGGQPKEAFTDPVSTVEEIFVTFVQSVKKARARATFRHVANVQRAGLGAPARYERDGDGNIVLDGKGYAILLEPARPPVWQASMRLLESAEREMWGRRQHVEFDTDAEEIAEQFEVNIVDKRTVAPEELGELDE